MNKTVVYLSQERKVVSPSERRLTEQLAAEARARRKDPDFNPFDIDLERRRGGQK